MDNEFTRKEKPCLLSGSEFCDREDANCKYCIAKEEAYQNIYTKDEVLRIL